MINSHKNKMNIVSINTALLFLLLIADLYVNASSLNYKELPVERVCRATKSEIRLSPTKPAVFYFDESKSGTLLKRDLDCHFELETTKDKKFGFLVVIDEMQIDEDKEKPFSENQKDLTVKDHRCSSDYVQFGRDSYIVTTKTSQKFCGDFEQVNMRNSSTVDNVYGVRPRVIGNKTRSYIEQVDHEMDLWIKLKKNRDPKRGQPGHKPFRKFRIIVTIFIKDCQRHSPLPQNEAHSKHNPYPFISIQPEGIPASSTPCFHQAYACDRVPNIIWPGKNFVTDESFCKDDFKPNPLSQDVTGESPRPAMQRISLPIILIIVVVSVLGLAGIALLARFAISRVKERQIAGANDRQRAPIPGMEAPIQGRVTRGEEQRGQGSRRPDHSLTLIMPGSNQTRPEDATNARGDEDVEMTELMAPPPSYEDATKRISQTVNPLDSDDPPPYQPPK